MSLVREFGMVILLSILLFLSCGNIIVQSGISVYAGSSSSKVLVIDWLSDPLLEQINMLVDEGFNDVGWLLRWSVGDLDLDSGLDYWGVIDYRSHEGNGSIWCATDGREDIIGSPNVDRHKYDDDMNAYLQTAISLLGRRSASITYYYWVDTELNYDWLAFQVSTQLVPTTWITLKNYTGTSSGWNQENISLDLFCGNVTVWLRFLFHSDGANHSYEGAYIDEVKVVASPLPFLDNSGETAFWSRIDNDPNIDVFIKPPAVVDVPASILAGRIVLKESVIDYIEEVQPDVIVLDDLCLDMFDIWGLNKTERLAVFDYIEQGHGLIMTYGSFFDMRLNATSIGPYEHVNRLYLEQTRRMEALRENYRSSLAAASGLGLLPFYEEAREQIANIIAESEPELAFIARSVPLLPIGVSFNGTFIASNVSDPILQGLGESFQISLTSKGVHANGTLVGWQLEYPFLMVARAINKTRLLMDQIRTVIKETLYQNAVRLASNISDIIGCPFPNLEIADPKLNDIINNATESMMRFLMSLYEARLKMPTEITIPVNFSIGNFSITRNITIQIPVEIQEIVKPATIVAESADGLAAILRYEAGNHRAVYFTFKPSLEPLSGPCEQLMKNAIKWTSEPPTPVSLTVVSNMGVPTQLINTIRQRLGLPDTAISKWNSSDVINKKRAYEYALELEKADSVVVYWYGDPAKVTLNLGTTTYTGVNVTVAGAHGAFIGYVPTAGTWILSIKLKDDDPLLTPVAFEVYPSYDTTNPSISTPHQEPETVVPNQNVTISVNVTDIESGIAEVILSYSTDNGATWNNETMTPQIGNTFMGQIPGFSEGTQVWYKVIAYDNAGNSETNDNIGQYYVYTVIPEFPTWLLLLFAFIVLTAAIILVKKR